jgi:hypothetical protein
VRFLQSSKQALRTSFKRADYKKEGPFLPHDRIFLAHPPHLRSVGKVRYRTAVCTFLQYLAVPASAVASANRDPFEDLQGLGVQLPSVLRHLGEEQMDVVSIEAASPLPLSLSLEVVRFQTDSAVMPYWTPQVP